MNQAAFELASEVDEDGFVALVCPGGYAGHVGPDWTLDHLFQRFVQQMNAQVLFIASPGPEWAGAPLRVSNEPASALACREASGWVRVSEGGLWLTDYTQLTMAAQFADEGPVAGHHLRLPVPAGTYEVVLRRLASPPSLELVIREAEAGARRPVADAIPWLK